MTAGAVVRFTLLFLGSTTGTFACPFCKTETGKAVRAQLFGPDFYTNVLLTLAPFPLLIGMILLVGWAIPDKKPRKRSYE